MKNFTAKVAPATPSHTVNDTGGIGECDNTIFDKCDTKYDCSLLCLKCNLCFLSLLVNPYLVHFLLFHQAHVNPKSNM